MADVAWPGLGDGAYRWAIKAQYPGPRLSAPRFTNVIGKNWLANVTVAITLTCNAVKPGFCLVKFVNSVAGIDTVYQKVSDSTGIVVFHNFWKGNYNMTVTRMGYNIYAANVDVFSDKTFNVLLVGVKLPPTMPTPAGTPLVNNLTLKSWWHPPQASVTLLNEDWSSGSFATNGWTYTGSSWFISYGAGKPAPCLDYNWGWAPSPYDLYVQSKLMPATNAPHMSFQYDISLSNFSPSGNNTMSAEIWTGSAWHVLKTWDNSGNDIPWTTDVHDVSAYAGISTRVRFHAVGDDDFYINDWFIDNIKVVASDGHSGPNPCVVGYNFYLTPAGGTEFLSGFTTDTTYKIPGTQVYYGRTYQACVAAVYGSGYSSRICGTFVSHFLFPPRDVVATQLECSAYITWKKPSAAKNVADGPVFTGKFPMTEQITTLAPIVPAKDQPQGTDNTVMMPAGTIAYGADAFTYQMVDFDVNNVGGWTLLGAYPSSSGFVSALIYPSGVSDYCYAAQYPTTTHLWKVIKATNVWTDLGVMGTADVRGFAIDPGTGVIYASDLYNLYTLNPATPALTLVGSFNLSGIVMISMTNDASGNLFGVDMSGNNLVSINKTTGTATTIGPLGFDPQYAQSAFFDSPAGVVTLGAYNLSNSMCEVRAVNTTTGNTTVLSSRSSSELTSAAVPGGAPPISGLIGYRVYRDDLPIHRVPSPDTLYYYDVNVDPGIHKYSVSAIYDLTAYPPNTGEGESYPEGPSIVNIICGRPLPFYEPWDQASFGYNNWTFNPSTQQHWVINSALGNPQPCADFKWDPPTNNYSLRLESPTLNGGPWSCANIYFDFDYKLVDHNGGETEKLTPVVYYNGTWHDIIDIKNNGSSANWIAKHLDISAAKGKGFKVGFKASGASSPNILHWYVDNINVYGVCHRPLTLTKTQSHDTINLSWSPPNCAGGQFVDLIFDDGTYEIQVFMNGGTAPCGNLFPVGPTMTGTLVSFDLMLAATGITGTTTMYVYDNAYNLLWTSPPFDVTAVDTWTHVVAPNIPFTGQFYAVIDIGTGVVNGLGLDQDGPFSAMDLTWIYYNGTWSTLNSVAPGVFGPTVALLRATAYVAFDQKSVTLSQPPQPGIISPAKVGTFYADYAHGGSKFTGTQGIYSDNSDGSIVAGYNVYRTDTSGAAPFYKRNNQLVQVTHYTDVLGLGLENYGDYKYYVTAVFKDTVANAILCESPGSDTVSVKFPAVGVIEIGNGQIQVYPNPATDNVNVKSTYTINGLEVMNYVGQTVYRNANVADKSTKFSVSALQSGVYFVKVNTVQGTRTVKVTVTH